MHDVIQGRRSYRYRNGRLVGALGQIALSGEQRAVCLGGSKDVGQCLRTDHGCGHNISKLDPPHNGSGEYVAEVIGWGNFLEGTHGWRTEWMEIIAIHCPSGASTEVRENLKDYYNCPVV